MISRTPNYHSRLRVERLEGRLMLDGNVLVNVVGGNLIVSGDGQDNDIEITARDDPGKYRVASGSTGTTTVNGKTAQNVSGVDGDFRIRMRGGDDEVRIEGLDVPGDLTIETHSGRDWVYVQVCNIGNDVSMNTGSGRDVVSLSDTYVAGSVAIETHRSRDELWISDLQVGDDLLIWAHDGNDRVAVWNTYVADQLAIRSGAGNDETDVVDSVILDDALIETGTGNDRLRVAGTRVADRVRVLTGAGNDRVEVRAGIPGSTLGFGVRANHVVIRAGTGKDNVKLRDSHVRRDAAISMEGGDDYLLLLDNFVGRNADLRGGGGNDTLNEDRNTWGGPVPTISGFETLLS